MTAYLVFDALKSGKIRLDQKFAVSERAWKMPGSRMFIDPKMPVPVEDLIKGMVVQSGNDATIALAEGVGGDVPRFVQMMNAQAQVLGLKGTSYKNPEGLTEPGHTTTARDLGILATRLMADFPQYMGYYALKKYRYPGTPAANDNNRNLLLQRDPTVDGLKTGYTEAAGYCMVATARRDYASLGSQGASPSRRLLSIVLGTANENARANESQKLLNWGFTAFEPVKLFDPGQAVVTAQVWKGSASTVRVGHAQGVLMALPAGSDGKVTTEVVRNEPLLAPITKGQEVATLRVLSGGLEVAQMPLQALEAVDQAGIFGRAWDALRLWIR
jgi:D-alanyl-D-alanine carboxypeptidase (penicillin-binding protein 5/6)